MRRLHVQIFLTFLGVVVLFGLLVSVAWWIGGDDDEEEGRAYVALQALIEEALPPSSAPISQLDQTLARLGEKTGARITVFDPSGEILSAFGSALPALAVGEEGYGWSFRRKTGSLVLSDGRMVVAQPGSEDHDGHGRGLIFLAIILGFVASLGIGAWPLARRLTRRLERLQVRVDQLGAGDLAARVRVEGKDEVAALARSFNQAADQIQKLVETQKNTLAAASHELRTPLARLSMAFELLEEGDGSDDSRAELRERVERDIAELDDLIEELLLASRLDAAPDVLAISRIDLLGLAAEEAARYDAATSGSPCTVQGDERLLRRLIRNLVENAQRHGGGQAEVIVEPTDGGAIIRVIDDGPGIPEEDRERIFAPFSRPQGFAEEGGGFGLGLFLVRQIARRHGGDARCVSHEGGTCFEITVEDQVRA